VTCNVTGGIADVFGAQRGAGGKEGKGSRKDMIGEKFRSKKNRRDGRGHYATMPLAIFKRGGV